MSPEFTELYQYFTKSMEYLLNEGRLFADKYPKAARALQLDESDIKDPDVRRLIESFALFDARLNWSIDQQQDIMANFLMNFIAPEILAPIPSATIIELNGLQFVQPINVPKFTEFIVPNDRGKICRFRTARAHNFIFGNILEIQLLEPAKDQNLYFLQPVDSGTQPVKSALFIKINLEKEASRIIVYINAEHETAEILLKSILCHKTCEKTPIFLYDSGVLVGHVDFLDDYGSFVDPNIIGNPYHEIYEYSILANKFHFFEIHLDVSHFIKQSINIIIPLSSTVKIRENSIHERLLLLNCVPAVNLFQKRSEPTLIEITKDEYPIVADIQMDLYKIYSITNLYTYNPNTGDEAMYKKHGEDYFIRTTSNEQDKIFVSLRNKFDQNFALENTSMYADLLCTNGSDSEYISTGASILIENLNHVKGKILIIPTQTRSMNTSHKWSLLSLFTSNQFTRYQNKLLEFVKHVLNIYSLNDKNAFESILSYEDIGIKKSKDAWKGAFCKTIVEIKLNDRNEQSFVLALIWARIFVQLTGLSSVAEVNLISSNGLLLKEMGPQVE